MRSFLVLGICCLLAGLLVVPARAGVEVVASKSLTVQIGGPRTGDAGGKYFNIEGKENDKHASFGVLVFEIPREAQGKKVRGMTLKLVQSVPKFAKDGAIRFFLAPDLDISADLKFDPSFPDGVGPHIKPPHPLGAGNFKKLETGKSDSFALTGDDTARERISKGGKICIVVLPADGAVAATYFGAGATDQDKENSPRLMLEVP